MLVFDVSMIVDLCCVCLMPLVCACVCLMLLCVGGGVCLCDCAGMCVIEPDVCAGCFCVCWWKFD
jgi:hypothetical protein